jgi:hypothetical protein
MEQGFVCLPVFRSSIKNIELFIPGGYFSNSSKY